MGEEIVISLKNVSKCFQQYAHPVDRLKELFLPSQRRSHDFWAIQDINLEIVKGQTVGIVGRNGSGKSTLLQIIAGILTPTMGEVQVKGRVSALLELGCGFNPEFTGRQNVFFNGRLLGLSQKEIEDKFDEIAGFADIGDFIDEPVKTYSSGMFIRLAFSVAINVNPEILIVDEALAVGDGVFIHRCMASIKDFQDSGGTMLFVSHDMGSVSRLCSQAVWLKEGNIVEIGEPEDISRHYQAWMYEQINDYQKTHNKISRILSNAPEKPQDSKNLDHINSSKNKINPFTLQAYKAYQKVERFGTGCAEIISFEVLDKNNEKAGFVYPKDLIKLVVQVMTYASIQKPIVGIMLYDRFRIAVTGFNTYQYHHQLSTLLPNQLLTVEFSLEWPEIQGGNYVLEPAIADGSQENHEMLDWLQFPLNIVSGVTDLTFGVLRIPSVEISHHIQESQSGLKYLERT